MFPPIGFVVQLLDVLVQLNEFSQFPQNLHPGLIVCGLAGDWFVALLQASVDRNCSHGLTSKMLRPD